MARHKEYVAHVAAGNFAECMKWFGEFMITAHSQDHSQNLLKELNTIVMSTPGDYTREDLDRAFMNLARSENYVMVFLAKPNDIQLKEGCALVDGIKNGVVQS